VRAVVIAEQNMEEEQLFQDAEFRKTLSDLSFAGEAIPRRVRRQSR
jgi:hypothetical protein